MNTPNDNHTVAFFEFIEKHDIQVPVIQRDYVQGQALTDKEKEKRDDFVKKLMDALLPDGVPCHLDFVYGGRESFGSGGAMPEDAPSRKRSKRSAAAWRRWPSSRTRPASVPGGFAGSSPNCKPNRIVR